MGMNACNHVDWDTDSKRVIKVIALDLEGTLISTAETRVPRPGLYRFLEFCSRQFERVAIFTAVDEVTFREIAEELVRTRFAPIGFQCIEYIDWYGEKKDLRCIRGVEPEEVVIVDDFGYVIEESQRNQWIEIETYDDPFPENDRELERVIRLLKGDK